MEIMHFKTQKERLDYLKGAFEEIVPQKVEVKASEEPKQTKKGKKKDDAVQAE